MAEVAGASSFSSPIRRCDVLAWPSTAMVGTVVERRVEDAAVVGSAGVSEMPFVRSHSTYKSTHM